jgi:integrase
MSELSLSRISRIDRAWLDEGYAFKRRPAGGGAFYRVVVDGTCSACEKHPRPARHLEYLRLPFPSKTEARRYVTALNADVQRGMVTPAGLGSQEYETVGAWLAEWRDNRLGSVTKRTRESYVQIVDTHLVPALGSVRLQELDEDAVNAFYRAQTAKGLSSSTVNKHHTILSMALAAAVRRHHLTRNPADPRANEITLPPRTGRESRTREHFALSDEQIDLLLTLVRDDRRLEVPVALAVLAGLRAQEVLALEWRDVDFERRLLHIERAVEQTRGEDGHPELRRKDPKSSAGIRAVPLSDDLAAILTRWHSRRGVASLAFVEPLALVFPDDHDWTGTAKDAAVRLMARSRLSGRWANWTSLEDHKATFGATTFHDLRHSAASYWLRHGNPLFRVSRWLGHSNITITENIYGHEQPDHTDATRISAPLAAVRKRREASGAKVQQLRRQGTDG